MPDQDLVPSPKATLEELSVDLGTLEQIALSDESLVKRVRRYVEWQTREHLATEVIRSIFAALIVGIIALVAGSATLDAFFWTVLGFLATFVAQIKRELGTRVLAVVECVRFKSELLLNKNL